MFTSLKKKIAVLLVISMVFSNAGFASLASSVDTIVNSANNNGTDYQKADALNKLLGEGGLAEEPEKKEQVTEPEEPEETTLAEGEGNDDTDPSETNETTETSEETESSETTIEPSELSETGESTSTLLADSEPTTTTTITETDPTTTTELVTTQIPSTNILNNQNLIVASESSTSEQDTTEGKNINAKISSDSETNITNTKLASDSEAIEKNHENTNSIIASESQVTNVASESIVYNSTIKSKDLNLATESTTIDLSTPSDVFGDEIKVANYNDTLFGAGDKYILNPNWLNGASINKNSITNIDILPYGVASPSTYDHTWDLESSNGLKGFKDGTNIYIWAEDDKNIYLSADASYLFSDTGDDKFISLATISNLNVVYTNDTTNMSHMFDGVSSILEINAVNFDTRNVTNTSYMFNGCNNLLYIYASDVFDVKNVTDSQNMFNDCLKLRSKEMNGGFDEFIYDSTKIDKERAFCKIAFDIDYGGSLERKYNNKGYLTDNNYRIKGDWFNAIPGGNKDDIITIRFDKYDDIPTGTRYILPDSYGLALYYDGATITFHPDRDKPICLNGGNEVGFFADFYNLTSFENLTYLDTSHAATFKYAFASLRSLETIDVSKFVTNHITSLYGMFESCTNLKEINGIGKWDTGWVWVSSFAFKNCSSLKELDLGNLYYHIYDTTEMYNLCTSLATIYVNNRNFSAIAQRSNNMFKRCDSLIGGQGSRLTWQSQTNFWSAQIDGLFGRSGFYTEYRLIFRPGWYEPAQGDYPVSNITEIEFLNQGDPAPTTYDYKWELPKSFGLVGYRVGSKVYIHRSNDLALHLHTDIRYLFSNSDPALQFSSLEKIVNFTSLDGIRVDNADHMFDGAGNLREIDLSNFFTETLRNTRYMFANCSNLTTIKASDIFTLDEVGNRCENMFDGCTSLVGKDSSGNEGTGTYSRYSDSNPKDITCAKLEENYGDKHGYLTDANYNVGKDWNKDINDSVIIDRSNVTKITFMKGGNAPSPYDNTYFIKDGNGLEGYIVNGTELIIYGRNNRRSIYLTNDATNVFKDATSITEFGSLDTLLTKRTTNMTGLFYNASQLTSVNLSKFDTSRVSTMSYMFYGTSAISSLDLSTFNTGAVSDMSYMFANTSSLTSLNLKNLNTSNVTNMSHMFDGASALTEIDLSMFDTSKVMDMSYMFKSMSNLQNIDVSNFVVSQIPNLEGMFAEMDAIEFIDLSTFIGVSSVTSNPFSFNNTYKMFEGCDNLKIIDITNFSADWGANAGDMFKDLPELTTIYCSYNWSVADSSTYVFDYCPNLVGSEGTSYADHGQMNKEYARTDKFNGDPMKLGYFSKPVYRLTKGWHIGSGLNQNQITSVAIYDYDPGASNQYDIPYSNGLKGGVNGTAITIFRPAADKAMTLGTSAAYVFSGYSSLTSVTGLNVLDSSKLLDTSHMFDGASSLTSFNMNDIDIRNVTNMSYMFNGASSLTNLTFTGANFSNVTNMSHMFCGAFNGTSGSLSIDLRGLDTRNVTDMSYMFSGVFPGGGYNVTTLDIRGLNTSKVTDMSHLFSNAGFRYLSFSGIDTSNVTNMSYMFSGAYRLNNIDLTGFDTHNLTDTSYMFSGCYGLTAIYVNDNFDLSNVINSENMFDGCDSLIGRDIDEQMGTGTYSRYNASNPKDKTLAIIEENFEGHHGYLSDKNYRLRSNWYNQCGTEGNPNSPENISKIVFASASAVDPTWTLHDDWWQIDGSNGLIGLRDSNVVTIYAPEARRVYAAQDSRKLFANSSDMGDADCKKGFGWSCGGFEFENLDAFSTSKVQNFAGAFKYTEFKSGRVYFDSFDTSRVKDFSNMFGSGPVAITETVNPSAIDPGLLGHNESVDLDITNFDTSSATNMMGVFNNVGFRSITHSENFVDSNVTNIKALFANAYNIDTIDAINFDVSSITGTGMEYLFYGCKEIERLDLSTYDTKNITSYKGLFVGCEALERIYVSDTWKVISSTSVEVFNGCTSLVGEEGSTKAGIAASTSEAESNTSKYARIDKANDDINKMGLLSDGNYILRPGWYKYLNATGNYPASGIGSIKFVPYGIATMSICDYDTEIPNSFGLRACRLDDTVEIYKVTNKTIYAYKDSTALFSDSDAYTKSMSFSGGMTNLIKIENINLLDTSKATTFSGMFAGARAMTSLDISSFNLDKVEKVDMLFYGMSSLAALDISIFDTAKITDMSYMFSKMGNGLSGTNYVNLIGLEVINTSEVTDMSYMFSESRISDFIFNIDNFDTSKVTNMSGMFKGIYTGGNELSVGSFKTSVVTDFLSMFENVTFTTIYATEHFEVSGTAASNNMFNNATNLKGGNGTSYSSSHRNGDYARIDEDSTPGYFTKDKYSLNANWDVGIGVNPSEIKKIIFSTPDMSIPANPIKVTKLPNSGGLKVYYYIEGSDKIIQIHTTRNVPIYTPEDSSYLFSGTTAETKFTSLVEIVNLDLLETSLTTNMSHMFEDANKIKELDVRYFETASVSDMSYMFNNCSTLKTIKASDSFDVTNVIDSTNMFGNCVSIKGRNINRDDITGYDPTKTDKSMAVIEDAYVIDRTIKDVNHGYLADYNYAFVGDISKWSLFVNIETQRITKITLTYDENDIPTSYNKMGVREDMNGLVTYRTNNTEIVIYARKHRPIYTRQSMNEMFGYHMPNIDEFVNFYYLNTRKTILANCTFEKWHAGPIDIGKFNWHRLQHAGRMFACGDLVGWNFDGADFSTLYYADYMFSPRSMDYDVLNEAGIDLSKTKWSNTLVNAYCMFESRCRTKKILLPESFSIENVWQGYEMFQDCQEIEELDLSMFKSTKVHVLHLMFNRCYKLKTIYMSKNFGVSNIQYNNNMFNDCTSLVGGNGTRYADKILEDPSNAKGVSYAYIDWGPRSERPGYFTYKSYLLDGNWYQGTYPKTNIEEVVILKYGDATPSTVDAEWDIPNSRGLKGYRVGNKAYISAPKDIDIYTAKNATGLFSGFTNLEKITNFENVNTISTNNMSRMFEGCQNLATVSLAQMDTTNATNMSDMFNGCQSLEEIELGWFNTASVSDMQRMFANCSNLKYIYTTSDFVTTAVTNSSNMFSGCTSLEGEYGTTLASISEIDPSHVYDKTYARLDKEDAPGYFIYGSPKPKPVPPPPPAPTPTPPPPAPYGPSGGGGGGGRGAGGPLTMQAPQKLTLNTVKTIKDSFSADNCAWIYDPVKNKWKLNATNAYGQTIEVKDGFYAITRLVDKVYISPNTIGNMNMSTYYFDADGYMYTGYIVTTPDNKIYYFDVSLTMSEGSMMIGWVKIMNDWYYFGVDGAMLINAITPDGFVVGADGKWVEVNS